jgi:hypothetical protein
MNLSPDRRCQLVIIFVMNRVSAFEVPAPLAPRVPPGVFWKLITFVLPARPGQDRAHLEPFQCSIKISRPCPTAQALVRETALTAVRTLSRLPAELGLATLTQLVPFQCSISGQSPLPVRRLPTAQALDGDKALTP